MAFLPLLLHACCAPCSSSVLERLCNDFAVTVYFYNPNIYPAVEYARRLEEIKGFIPRFASFNKIGVEIPVIEGSYEREDFYRATNAKNDNIVSTAPEKGIRCERCYRLRLAAAFAYAREREFSYVATTLTVSPHKDAALINAIGIELADAYIGGPRFFTADFKKKEGYKRSIALSAEYGLYRQDYCGCEYSKMTRYAT